MFGTDALYPSGRLAGLEGTCRANGTSAPGPSPPMSTCCHRLQMSLHANAPSIEQLKRSYKQDGTNACIFTIARGVAGILSRPRQLTCVENWPHPTGDRSFQFRQLSMGSPPRLCPYRSPAARDLGGQIVFHRRQPPSLARPHLAPIGRHHVTIDATNTRFDRSYCVIRPRPISSEPAAAWDPSSIEMNRVPLSGFPKKIPRSVNAYELASRT